MNININRLFVDTEVDHFNRRVLLQRFNEKDAWDVDLAPKHLDRLSVTLTCKQDGGVGYITYGFEFDANSNRFIECEYDAFEWLSDRSEEGSGEVKSFGRIACFLGGWEKSEIPIFL